MSRPPSRPNPDLGQRRRGRVAVALVLACLVGLAVWVALGRATPAPQRTPATQGALHSPPSGPLTTAGETPTTPGSTGPGGVPLAGDPGPGGSLDRVDWTAIDHPLSCDGTGEKVESVHLGDLNGRPPSEAVVAVRCDAGAGSPPSGLYVYAGRLGDVRLLGTLLRPEDDVLLTSVSVRGEVVTATGTTYSSDQVPRCCPDERFAGSWRWDGGTFRRTR